MVRTPSTATRPGPYPSWFVMPYLEADAAAASALDETLAALSAIPVDRDNPWGLALVIDPPEAPAPPDSAAGQVHPASEAVATVRDLLDRHGLLQRTLLLPQASHIGTGPARNVGVSAAADHGADVILFLDADDLPAPDRLTRTRAVFAEHPEVDLIYSTFEVMDEHGRPRDRADLPASIATILSHHPATDHITAQPWRDVACRTGYISLTSTVAVRTDLARQVPFPATIASEDSHVWLRMFAAARSVAYVSTPLAHYRVPRGTVSNSRARHGPETFRWVAALANLDALVTVLFDQIGHGALTPEQATDVLGAAQRREAVTAESEGVKALAEAMLGLAALHHPSGPDVPC